MKKAKWTELKRLVDQNNSQVHHIDHINAYTIWTTIDGMTVFAEINKTNPRQFEQEVFEDCYKDIYACPPTNITLSNNDVLSGSSACTLVGSFTATGGTGPYTWSLTYDPDDKFKIVCTNKLKLKNSVCNVVNPCHDITTKVIDNNGLAFSKSFTINILACAVLTNKAVKGNGVDEKITLNNIAELYCSTNPITIGFKLKRISGGTSDVVFDGRKTCACQQGTSIFFDACDYLHYRITDNVTTCLYLDRKIWMGPCVGLSKHVFITYSGNKAATGIKYYVNSTLTGGTTDKNGAICDDVSGICVASMFASSACVCFMNAHLSHFMVWSIEFNQCQINEIYNSGCILTDLSGTTTFAYNIMHTYINSNSTYPTLTDSRGNYNLTMNGDMNQSNIVDET